MSTLKAITLSDYIDKRKKSDRNFTAIKLAEELGMSKQLLNFYVKSGTLLVIQGKERRLYKPSRSV